ncbi:hypothetical protein B0A50_01019 [Salinomyces thailandicus]|uniref:Uncharacterized protein n=1 Tax=Salinomyces thailandicus TaxID=706561 RepID=A0A4U0UC15_9PEZI|nr:hypothetical protein B0A50_01019 [Salinomyces thailandica]
MAEVRKDEPAHAGNVGTQQFLLYAAGFNAFSQLDASHTHDLRSFAPLSVAAEKEQEIDVVFAGWCSNILSWNRKLWRSIGAQNPIIEAHTLSPVNETGSGQCCAVGDHNGLRAYTDGSGALYWLADKKLLTSGHAEEGPQIGQIALAGNERVAMTFKAAAGSQMCHVVEFEDVSKAVAWYQDPSDPKLRPAAHHMLHGRAKRLLAGTATFLLLMEGGEVYSWGDPRQQSLGRTVTARIGIPPHIPGAIEALGGLKITKIACGGWLNAALAGEDGALYLWGAASKPSSRHSIRCMQEAEPGEVVLVDVVRSRGHGDSPHLVDVAVGDAHVVAVTVAGEVYAIGDNGNGQLGLRSEDDFFEDWQEVEQLRRVKRVVCGPKSTFVVVGTSST